MAAVAVLAAAFGLWAGTTGVSSAAPTPTAAAAAPTADWLHANGNKIVDEAGNKVWLTGTNWFGFNASERVFHGLWSGNITKITKAMADRGINIVRVPISTELLLEWKAGTFRTTNVNTHANPELADKNSLQIFDYWLELCERYGLKVMIDVHSAEADNSGHLAPVWYKGSITPEMFYQGWEWITARYRNDDTIVAMDIKNEPHGKPNESPRAKWDNTTDQDNWKHAAETAARRILAINPNLLVLVEGIEIYPREGKTWSSPATSPDGSENFHFNWWGGNLRGVRDHPINLGANQDQLVYSPHDYGPLVYEQPWFKQAFDKASLTRDVWRPNWLYIHEGGTAPLLIGEWGGRLGQDARQDKWMTALRDLMIEHGIHHTFWALNPNSGDTGGLLLDDWATWDEQKYAMLKPALWQHNNKFVGLDHQVRLGGVDSATGMSLADRYGDGGGGGGGGDTTAPTVPGQPAASDITATGATLTWSAATDNVGVTAYDVLRATGDGAATVVGSVSGTRFTATGLSANTRYTFSVRARDAAGNTSAASPGRTLTTAAEGGGNTSAGCTATYKLVNVWPGGFQGEVVVKNTGTTAINGWTVTWTAPGGIAINSLWGGRHTVSGSAVTVRNETWNASVAPNGSASFGFTANGSASVPTNVTCAAP
jgi:aryl-phospho-beta-D-glucosidase BglC (GH1 family)/chitodextrinase